MSRYNTNFAKGKHGNELFFDKLRIIIDDNPVYITGQLFKNGFFKKKLIQIEQTGTRNNPQKDSIVFEMLNADKTRMDKGTYTVKIYSYFDGLGGKSWTDKFELV